MHTIIGKAVDLLEHIDGTSPALNDTESLIQIIMQVQQEYLDVIKKALSLLVQDKPDECHNLLQNERDKLESVKEKISTLASDTSRWQSEYLKLSIEYLFTRARLVDELRMFPDFTLELLERQTVDQALSETISYLETAMTGKKELFEKLRQLQPT